MTKSITLTKVIPIWTFFYHVCYFVTRVSSMSLFWKVLFKIVSINQQYWPSFCHNSRFQAITHWWRSFISRIIKDSNHQVINHSWIMSLNIIHSSIIKWSTINRVTRKRSGWRDYLMKRTTSWSHQKIILKSVNPTFATKQKKVSVHR